MQCFAVHVRFLTCLQHNRNEQETLRDLWALRNPLPVGGCTKDIQCVQ